MVSKDKKDTLLFYLKVEDLVLGIPKSTKLFSVIPSESRKRPGLALARNCLYFTGELRAERSMDARKEV